VADHILTDTLRYRDIDRGRVPAGRYVWRGPADQPVFHFADSREIVVEDVEVVCETPTPAVFHVERTRVGPGVHPSTLHHWCNVRINGGNARPACGFLVAGIDQNGEHMRFDGVSVYRCDTGWSFRGQQAKEQLLTQCRAESCAVGIAADSGFTWISGCIAACAVGVELTRVGDPVVIQGVGFEAVGRMLVTSGPTTASQPVTLLSCRYEADQLHADGDCILLRHPGPLLIQGCRFGGGAQRIPRIALTGFGEQSVEIHGSAFGSYGAADVCPIRASTPSQARVTWGRNVYQRSPNDPQNTDARVTWASAAYV
jgi:hypothetical protein